MTSTETGFSSCRPRQAAQMLSISLATLWRRVRDTPDFPRPIRISSGTTLFDVGELKRWRDAKRAPEYGDATERRE